MFIQPRIKIAFTFQFLAFGVLRPTSKLLFLADAGAKSPIRDVKLKGAMSGTGCSKRSREHVTQGGAIVRSSDDCEVLWISRSFFADFQFRSKPLNKIVELALDCSRP